MKLTSSPFNDTKAAGYSAWQALPENKGHKAWMHKAEIAQAAELAKHVREKTPWLGYNTALLARHRHADGSMRKVVEYACLDSFDTLTPPTKKQKQSHPLA